MERVEIRADVPAEAVFALLTDWRRQREWMPFTRVEGGGHETGAQMRAWTGLGPVGFWDTMVITEWTPGRKVVVLHTGRLVRGEAWFETEPLPSGGCRIVWAEALEPPFGGAGKAAMKAGGPVFRVFMRVGLRRLARLAKRSEHG